MDFQRSREQLIRFAASKRCSPELQQDFAQYVELKQLEGRESTLEFLLVDFLRHELGHPTHSPNRYALSKTCEFNDELHAEQIELMSDHDYNVIIKNLKPKQKAYLNLKFKWGLTLKEIGQTFGVTEGRVSQEINEILTRLNKPSLSEHYQYSQVEANT